MADSTSTGNICLLTKDAFARRADERVREYRRKWRENPLEHRVEEFPVHLDIESTSVCNLRCVFCAGTYEQYPKGAMDFGLFERIIDEGAEKGLHSIKLNFRGEPLMHPRIADMVAYAKRKGLTDVFFNTNATLLTEDVGRRLLDAGLDRLIVSFEGVDQPTYEANRVGAGFETVVANVRAFSRLKRERAPGMTLRLQSVAIEDGPDYARRYEEFWQQWADEMTIIDLRDETQDHTGAVSDEWECPYPWLRLCVTFSGQTYTCPFVNQSPQAIPWAGLGDANLQSIASMWRGEAMESIRQGHMGRRAHLQEPCRRCSHRGTEIAKLAAGRQA